MGFGVGADVPGRQADGGSLFQNGVAQLGHDASAGGNVGLQFCPALWAAGLPGRVTSIVGVDKR